MLINAAWRPVTPTIWQLALVVRFLPSTSTNTVLALGVVTLDQQLVLVHGLVPSSTGAYTACPDCNLHCVVVVVVHGSGYNSMIMGTSCMWQLVRGVMVGLWWAFLIASAKSPCAQPYLNVAGSGGTGALASAPNEYECACPIAKWNGL